MANLLTFATAKSKLNLPPTLETEFNIFIERAETIRIKPILGDALFAKLIAGSYATLKTAVNLCTIYWANDYYIREGNNKSTALGVLQKTSQYSTNDKYERQLLLDSNLHTAHFYESKLLDMLNTTDYPEWVDSNTKTENPNFNISVGDRKNYTL